MAKNYKPIQRETKPVEAVDEVDVDTIETVEAVDEVNTDKVTLLFKGEFYSGSDGFGNFIVAKKGQTVEMSRPCANGVLESWSNEWEES